MQQLNQILLIEPVVELLVDVPQVCKVEFALPVSVQ